MRRKDGTIQIRLTREQQKQIQDATGKEAETLEFNIMELEERIAPLTKPWKPGN